MKPQAIFTGQTPVTSTQNGREIELPPETVGARFFLDVSAVSGTTPSMTVKLQVKDPTSGNFVDLPGAVFAAKTAVGTDELTIYPGITAAANRAVSSSPGRTMRGVATITGTTPSFTYTLTAMPLR